MDANEYEKLKENIKILEERIVFLDKLNKQLVDQNKELLKENDKKAELLAFLPEDSKKQFDLRGSSATLRYNMVTVLYSDVKGFAQLTETQDAQALIDELDDFFFKFDETVEKNNIEKIKSIGDTYICAGGIPRKNRTNPIEVIKAAFEMKLYLEKLQDDNKKDNKNIWGLTFGLHTGPVVATVSGKKKKSYDIKGDTVNIASRIEATSQPGELNISQMTYEFVKGFFTCQYKSKLPIKYKGDIPIYSVVGYRPELSVDGNGIVPNEMFNTKLQTIKFEDLNDYVLDRLERELPKHLYYHDLKHTIDVVIGVEIIGSGEGVTEQEMLLLKTAALFHDFGQTIQSAGHENISCNIARKILPDYGYTAEQIETIEGIIMATQLPPNPQTLLQKIICDADLDYLGRADFIPVSDTLHRELKVQGIIGSLKSWNVMQVKFLSAHQFFTDTAKNMRRVNKFSQIERLKKLIEEDDSPL